MTCVTCKRELFMAFVFLRAPGLRDSQQFCPSEEKLDTIPELTMGLPETLPVVLNHAMLNP